MLAFKMPDTHSAQSTGFSRRALGEMSAYGTELVILDPVFLIAAQINLDAVDR